MASTEPVRVAEQLFQLPTKVTSSFAFWRAIAIHQSDSVVRATLEGVDRAMSDAFGRVKGSQSRATATWPQLCLFFPEGALEAYMREALLRLEVYTLPDDLVASFETTLPADLRGIMRGLFCRSNTCGGAYCHGLYEFLSGDPTPSIIAGATAMAITTEREPTGLLGALPAAARRGFEQGGAMVAQDIIQDATRAILVEGLGVDPKTLEIKNDLVRDLANVLGPALLNIGAAQATDSLPGARFLAAASEAAFTGRVSYATYKHGTRVTELVKLIAPQLNELRKVGAKLLGETLQPGDLQEVEGENIRTKKKAAS